MSDPGFLADVAANGPEEAKQLLRKLGLYTHVGYRPRTGYQHCGARLWGHTTPRPGKTHALTLEVIPGFGTRWRALCGDKVPDCAAKDDHGDPIPPNVRPAPDEAGGGVTCRRCRRKIAGK